MYSPIVALTGASGSVYGVRLLELLVESGVEPVVLISDAGRLVLKVEMGSDRLQDLIGARGYRVESVQNFASPIASGSYETSGMVIAPCSMGTVAAIAHGISSNLIHRAADVVLKERRKLIVVPRETPLHVGHLKNLATLSELGALILPAMPAFYHKPHTIEELVDSVVARILDHMEIDHPIIRRWGQVPPKIQEVPLDDRI